MSTHDYGTRTVIDRIKQDIRCIDSIGRIDPDPQSARWYRAIERLAALAAAKLEEIDREATS